MVGAVVSLHAGGAGLPKHPAPSLVLIEAWGAQGDRHAGKEPDRAVLLTPASSYLYLARAGLRLPYGMLGENIVVGDLDLHELLRGTRLQLGEAMLELTTPCTVCSSLSAVDLRLPKLAYGRRGVYARVLKGGTVCCGQAVTVMALSTGATPSGPLGTTSH